MYEYVFTPGQQRWSILLDRVGMRFRADDVRASLSIPPLPSPSFSSPLRSHTILLHLLSHTTLFFFVAALDTVRRSNNRLASKIDTSSASHLSHEVRENVNAPPFCLPFSGVSHYPLSPHHTFPSPLSYITP